MTFGRSRRFGQAQRTSAEHSAELRCLPNFGPSLLPSSIFLPPVSVAETWYSHCFCFCRLLSIVASFNSDYIVWQEVFDNKVKVRINNPVQIFGEATCTAAIVHTHCMMARVLELCFRGFKSDF